MSQEQLASKVFENGATWLRADFHLHTIKDKEFSFENTPTDFFNQYIQQLKDEKVNIGVLTNHNKFDKDEYVNLRKKAIKDDIWILPGVELSVNDGGNGIHCLIAFDYTAWVINNDDFINHFLTAAFEGIPNRENENTRCNYNLDTLLKKLNEHKLQGRESFIIMAHVEQSSGFLSELDGGRIQQLAGTELFREFVLAFQKFRSYDKLPALNIWFANKLPAFVEGSDCKCIAEVGKSRTQKNEDKKTYLKIGAYNFDALKYALLDHINRLSPILPTVEKAYLKSITLTTSKWRGKKASFNAAMNNLIGIRGSGKSSILETVRYALDIPLGSNSHEPEYKEKLVQNFLGSGGKMEIELIDKHGHHFIAEKIYGESTNIYRNGELQHNVKVSAILNKPLYYGQKDLSDIGGETSTEDLISKLMGDKLNDVAKQIDEQAAKIITMLGEIRKADKSLSQKEEIETKKAAIELNMKIFKDLEIDKKLNKQIEFNKDSNRLDTIISFEETLINSMTELYNDYKDQFTSYTNYESKENSELFKRVYSSFSKFQAAFTQLAAIIKSLQVEKGNLELIRKEFTENYEKLKEEFSQIKREINLPNIEADAYVRLSKNLDLEKAKLVEIVKLSEKRKALVKNFNEALVVLRNLWHKEYLLVQDEVDGLNKSQNKIRIEVEFKGNKEKLKDFLRANVRGSGLRDAALSEIADHYPDLIEVYNDFAIEGSRVNSILSGGNNLSNFKSKFSENINAFLTYRTPDKYTIYYNERPLQEHSLGQRASALIIFILTLKENDIIIIDQPEDDLDNQTIYTDVISELRKLKNETQFIFATHNPNIPVLGDCEQTISCTYINGTVDTLVGSIDDVTIQKKIVNIMEGGEEAFNQRKMIYKLWSH